MLEKDGFTNDQAKGLVLLVNEAITESMVSAIQSMVPKTEQQQEEEEMNKQLQLLTDEINTLEKKDFATIKGELARITEMVNTIKGNMRDDINRIHGGIRLDANLEKARMKEESDDLIKQLDLAGFWIDARGKN
ncbi:hypothetical protein EDD86DRAFT_219384 [Gorgonomyces haynaldii]|nr:hypothetical protein EDD86DRAFT_219384 [Gorgonomyces haynaldii]